MKVIKSVNEDVECVLTKDELLMIKNSLGELCYGIDLPAFATRVGFSRDDVGELAQQAKRIIDDLGIEE